MKTLEEGAMFWNYSLHQNDASGFLLLFHNGCLYHIETSPLICSGFYWFLYDRELRHERVNPLQINVLFLPSSLKTENRSEDQYFHWRKVAINGLINVSLIQLELTCRHFFERILRLEYTFFYKQFHFLH